MNCTSIKQLKAKAQHLDDMFLTKEELRFQVTGIVACINRIEENNKNQFSSMTKDYDTLYEKYVEVKTEYNKHKSVVQCIDNELHNSKMAQMQLVQDIKIQEELRVQLQQKIQIVERKLYKAKCLTSNLNRVSFNQNIQFWKKSAECKYLKKKLDSQCIEKDVRVAEVCEVKFRLERANEKLLQFEEQANINKITKASAIESFKELQTLMMLKIIDFRRLLHNNKDRIELGSKEVCKSNANLELFKNTMKQEIANCAKQIENRLKSVKEEEENWKEINRLYNAASSEQKGLMTLNKKFKDKLEKLIGEFKTIKKESKIKIEELNKELEQLVGDRCELEVNIKLKSNTWQELENELLQVVKISKKLEENIIELKNRRYALLDNHYGLISPDDPQRDLIYLGDHVLTVLAKFNSEISDSVFKPLKNNNNHCKSDVTIENKC